ncbi:MAG: lysophospholipid acyltransferase family protein [Planctomycetota bacterium]|nr:lysophospholipid acyltransferase family protein [Planctomycetota bacterium]
MGGTRRYRAALRVARAAAAVARRARPRVAATVRENLRLAYGSADRRLVRGVFRHFAEMAVDLAFFDDLFDPSRVDSHFERSGPGWDQFSARARNGAVFVTGHFGNWELYGVALRHHGIPIAPVARPLDGGRMGRWLDRFRRRHGQEVIAKKQALPLALKALRAGRNVAFLNDQAAGRHGIPAPFFGRDVSTFPAPVALARKAGVPLFAGYSTRLGDGIRYRCHAEEVPLEGDDAAMTARLNRILEGYVRACPEQWWWFHRRFKPRRSERAGRAVTPAGVPVS